MDAKFCLAMSRASDRFCCLCPPTTRCVDPASGRHHRHRVTPQNIEAVCSAQPTDHARVVLNASFCCLHLVPGHKRRMHNITAKDLATQDAAPRAASKQYASSPANGRLAPKSPPAQLKRKREADDADMPVVSPKRPGAPMSATSMRGEFASLRVSGITPAVGAFLASRASTPRRGVGRATHHSSH